MEEECGRVWVIEVWFVCGVGRGKGGFEMWEEWGGGKVFGE